MIYPERSQCNSRGEAIAFPNYRPAVETRRDVGFLLRPPPRPAGAGLRATEKALGRQSCSGGTSEHCFKGIAHLLNSLEGEVNAQRRRESPVSAQVGSLERSALLSAGLWGPPRGVPVPWGGGLEANDHHHQRLPLL